MTSPTIWVIQKFLAPNLRQLAVSTVEACRELQRPFTPNLVNMPDTASQRKLGARI